MADSPKERKLEEIISDIKAAIEETERSEPANGFKASNSCMQVPQEESHPEPASFNPEKLQLDQHPLVSSMPVKLPTNKSRLSPLAARAALASLVSTAYDDVANGTELDDHHITKNLAVVDHCSSENPSILVLASTETVDLVKKLSFNENDGSLEPQLEESTEVSVPTARSKRPNTRRKVAEFPKAGRVTRSSIKKAKSPGTDTEDIGRRSFSNNEVFSLPSGSEDRAEDEDDNNLNAKPDNSKGSKPKKSTVVQRREQESSEIELGMCSPAEEVVEPTEGKAKGQSRKRKSIGHTVPSRVTRSTIQKSTGNADDGVQGKSNDEEVKGRASKKTRRSTRSAGLETQSPDMTMSKEESTLVQKKETVTMDSKRQSRANEEVKAKSSNSSKKAQQTEGKVVGRTAKTREQNEKATPPSKNQKATPSSRKQEQRFSPRLRFLPRTRSQVKP